MTSAHPSVPLAPEEHVVRHPPATALMKCRCGVALAGPKLTPITVTPSRLEPGAPPFHGNDIGIVNLTIEAGNGPLKRLAAGRD